MITTSREAKMRVVSIVGARPQFIKAAAVSRELRVRHEEILVHTGQHYDQSMSGVFFDTLDLPPADVNLGIGSGPHGQQTGDMLQGIEKVIKNCNPDWVLVYGDTNSTLAGALAAAKMHVPIVHVEAGLRSFNRRMPEEINRVVADHLSDLLLCPSRTSAENLASEGIARNVHVVGDVMLDVLNLARERVESSPPEIVARLRLVRGQYVLATVHRGENTDDPQRLRGILEAFNRMQQRIIFPVHPRTRKSILQLALSVGPHVEMIDPVNYFEMVALVAGAQLVLTDSGGLQKETYWLGVPCVTLRDETEWVETVEAGWNCLVGAGTDVILQAAMHFRPPVSRPNFYGEGAVAAKCVALLG